MCLSISTKRYRSRDIGGGGGGGGGGGEVGGGGGGGGGAPHPASPTPCAQLELPDFSAAYSEVRQMLNRSDIISNRCVKCTSPLGISTAFEPKIVCFRFGPRLTGARHPEYAGFVFR
jgi:hypothetical protein